MRARNGKIEQLARQNVRCGSASAYHRCAGSPHATRSALRTTQAELCHGGFGRHANARGFRRDKRFKVYAVQKRGFQKLTFHDGARYAHERLIREHNLAFGDGFNDIPMLRAAGLGVAMANAQPPVKAAAKALTDSNDEDGVAHALDKWLLG